MLDEDELLTALNLVADHTESIDVSARQVADAMDVPVADVAHELDRLERAHVLRGHAPLFGPRRYAEAKTVRRRREMRAADRAAADREWESLVESGG